MELDKILTLSTAHVSPGELDAMAQGRYPSCKLAVDEREHFWTAFFFITPEDEMDEDGVIGLIHWPSLAACLEFAASQGCRYLRLDPDADTVADLPEYH